MCRHVLSAGDVMHSSNTGKIDHTAGLITSREMMLAVLLQLPVIEGSGAD